MKYSVVVPYHSNQRLFQLCISALNETVPEDTEIIVVANNDDPKAMDIAFPKRCAVIRVERSLYYPRAINLGVQNAHGEYVILMDADVCVRAGWIEAMSTVFERYPHVGGCSAKMLDPFDGEVKEFGIGFTGYNFPHPFAGRRELDELVCSDREVQAFCSAASMYRRDVFLQLGGMDEQLVDGYSDIDLCLRLRAAGLSAYVAAGAVVYHHGSSTHGSGMSSGLRADTKGYFMAHTGGQCQIDMERYYRMAFQAYRHSLEKEYFLIDFTTIANRSWHYDLFTDLSHFRIWESHRIPDGQRDSRHIALYTRLDDNIRRRPQSICFFVDDFRSIRNNQIWMELRDHMSDIVIDRNANIFRLDEVT